MSWLADEGEGSILLSLAATVAVLAYLFGLTTREREGRPLSLMAVFVVIMLVRTVPLLAVSLLAGIPGYYTSDGTHSYGEGAWLVASVRILFITVIVLTGLAVRRGLGRALAWRSIADRFDESFLDKTAWAGVGLMALRALLLFTPDQAGSPLAYFGRILLTYFLPLLFFAGVAVRRGHVAGIALAAVCLPVSAITLLAGSRGEALFPLLVLGLGFVAGRETPPKQLVPWIAAAFPLLLAAGFFGERIRGDQKARTGQSAIERTNDISGALDQVERTEVLGATFLRMASTSEHAVMTRIPQELPHEENGIVSIPIDFLLGFLPRFEFDGKSQDTQPRHWILNDLGFLVNWETSVELTLLADSWIRGGLLAVLLVGILVGLVLQRLEDFLYRLTLDDPAWFATLVFAVAGVAALEITGIALGLRALAFHCTAGVVVSLLSRGRRSAPGASRLVPAP